MSAVEINYLAVVACALASMVIGFVWYGPLFGRQWMSLIGKTEDQLKKSAGAALYVKAFISALILSYVLAHFIDYTGAKTLAEGLQTGFWAWLGFVATTKYVEYLFAGKSMQLYILDVGYHLAELLVFGVILATWA